MRYLLPTRSEDVFPHWTPSYVRRRLASARAGNNSPSLATPPANQDRHALSFLKKAPGGAAMQELNIEVLAGEESRAALNLLSAMRSGELIANVLVSGEAYQIAADYWAPLHDAAALCAGQLSIPYQSFGEPKQRKAARLRLVTDLQKIRDTPRSSLLWAEDVFRDHSSLPLTESTDLSALGEAVLINQCQAANWIDEVVRREVTDAPATFYPGREDEMKRVAAVFDARNISVRKLRKADIGTEWNPAHGPDATVVNIQSLMKGGLPGRPPD